MSVAREPASAPAAEPHPRLFRVVAAAALLSLVVLGVYQLLRLAEADRAAAIAAWTAGRPALGQAWAATQSMWHAVTQAMAQPH